MRKMDLGSIIIITLLDLSEAIQFLLLIWILYMFIDYVWGGLANAFRIIFFPGALLNKATRVLVAKIFGVEARVYAKESLSRGRASIYLRIRDPFMATVLAISPAFTAIPFYLLARHLMVYSGTLLAKVVSAWLAMSIFIAGLPNFGDLGYVVSSVIASKPHLQLFLVWSIVIFILALNVFDMGLAVIVTLSYVFLIILANASFGKRDEELPIIINED